MWGKSKTKIKLQKTAFQFKMNRKSQEILLQWPWTSGLLIYKLNMHWHFIIHFIYVLTTWIHIMTQFNSLSKNAANLYGYFHTRLDPSWCGESHIGKGDLECITRINDPICHLLASISVKGPRGSHSCTQSFEFRGTTTRGQSL